MNLVSDLVIKKLFQEDNKHGWHANTRAQTNKKTCTVGLSFTACFFFIILNWETKKKEDEHQWVTSSLSYVSTNNITTPPNSGQPYKKFWKKKKASAQEEQKENLVKGSKIGDKKEFFNLAKK